MNDSTQDSIAAQKDGISSVILMLAIAGGFFGVGADAVMNGQIGRAVGAFLIGALIVIAGALWHKIARRMGPVWAAQTAKLSANPKIWLGLLLIAFTYISWPHFAAPFLHPNTVALNSESASSPLKPSGPAKHYELVGEALAARSPTDADHEIPILDSLSEIFQKEADPTSRETDELLSHWPDAFRSQSGDLYLLKLKTFRADIARIDTKMTGTAQQVFAYCRNDLCEILGQRQGDALANALDRFISIIGDLQTVVDMKKFANDNQLSHVIVPHLEAVEETLHAYQEWSGTTQNKLSKRRDQLSEIASPK